MPGAETIGKGSGVGHRSNKFLGPRGVSAVGLECLFQLELATLKGPLCFSFLGQNNFLPSRSRSQPEDWGGARFSKDRTL